MIPKIMLFTALFSFTIFAQSYLPSEYFPLKDNLTNKFTIPVEDGTSISVTETTKENNGEFTITTSLIIAGNNVIVRTVYKNVDNSIYEVASSGGMLFTKITRHEKPYGFILYPIIKDSSWRFIDEVGRKINREIIGTLPEVDLMGKKFIDILKMKQTIHDGDHISVHYQYYAKGVGLIFEELESGKKVKYLVE